MLWSLKSRQEIEEVETLGSNDATIAIMAATVIDDRLALVIRSRLRNDQKIARDLFGIGGPIGDFGTKIKLGYMLGIYSKLGYEELDTVRRVRNEFAHQVRSADFLAERIRDRCMGLKIVESALVTRRSSDSSFPFYDYGDELQTPKGRFVVTARFMMDILEIGSILEVRGKVELF